MALEKEGNQSIIRLPRFFNSAAVKTVIQTGHEALKEGADVLVVDFNGTDMIDSAGIGSLVSIAKDFKARGGKLTLRNLNASIQELFFDSDLDKIFDIQTDQGIQTASVDLFKTYAEIRLDIKS